MTMNMDGPFSAFCDELDELITRWANKPEDDQLSIAEMVGAMAAKQHYMIEAAGNYYHQTEGDT